MKTETAGLYYLLSLTENELNEYRYLSLTKKPLTPFSQRLLMSHRQQNDSQVGRYPIFLHPVLLFKNLALLGWKV